MDIVYEQIIDKLLVNVRNHDMLLSTYAHQTHM